MDITGDPDGRPTMAGTYVVDYSTGLYATIGTLGALQARSRSGSGQIVDVALLDSALSMLMTAIPEQMLLGRTMTRRGNRDRYGAPANTFPTRDGAWVHLATAGEPMFRALADAMGRRRACRRSPLPGQHRENGERGGVGKAHHRLDCDPDCGRTAQMRSRQSASPRRKWRPFQSSSTTPHLAHRGQILEHGSSQGGYGPHAGLFCPVRRVAHASSPSAPHAGRAYERHSDRSGWR